MQPAETPEKRRLRVVQIFRGEPLSERSFLLEEPGLLTRRALRVTLGQSGDDTFTIPVCPLPPSFPLVRAVAGHFVLRVAEGMIGKLHLSGRTLSVDEFFAGRIGVAVSDAGASGLREHVLEPDDWGILATEPSAQVAFFFQLVPLAQGAWDMRPRHRLGFLSGIPFISDPFAMQGLAIAAVIHLSVLVLAFMARDGDRSLQIAPHTAKRLARISAKLPAQTAASDGVDDHGRGLRFKGVAGALAGNRSAAPLPLLSDDRDPRPLPERPDPWRPVPLHPAPPPSPEKPAPLEPAPPIAPSPGARARTPTPAQPAPAIPAPVQKTRLEMRSAADPPARPQAAPARPLRPVVESGTPMASGPLTRAQLDRVISFHQAEILACYRRELISLPTLAGRFTLVFSVDPAGTVSRPLIRDSTMKNAILENCVLTKVQSWRFPSARSPTQNISVLFTLRLT